MPEGSTTHDPENAIRRTIEALNRRDFDAAMALYAPNAVWDIAGLAVYDGSEAIRGLLEDWLGTYEEFEQVLEEFRDLGNGVTFSVACARSRLAGSSGFIELRYGGVLTWSDGLVERFTTYSDLDQGRADAEQLAEKA
jgi:hypothetical protein